MRGRVVGRETEIAALRDAVDRLPTGGVVVVEGEPGVGKSTLLDVVATRAGAGGSLVLRTGADEFSPARPLGVLHAGLAPADAADVDALLTSVERRADGRGATIVIDDVQWADTASLSMLAPFIRRAVPAGVLVVLAMRSWPRVPALVDLIDRIGTLDPLVLRLDPLTAAELRVLGEVRLGRPVANGLASLLDRSGGNPFYALSLLGALESDGRLTTAADGTIDIVDTAHDLAQGSLAAVVTRRVGALGAEVERTLRHAAVLGRSFGVSELAAVTAVPVEVVVDHVAVAADADVIDADGEQLAFRHDLVRSALEAALPPALRMAIHRRAADLAQERGDRSLAAAHLTRAEVGPADVEALVDAAEACSPDVGIVLIDRALALLDRDDARYAQLAGRRVDLLLWNGDAERAIEEARTLLASDPEPALGYSLRTTIAHALFVLGRAGEAVDTWVPFPDDTDDVLRAGELSEQAFAALFAGRLPDAATLAARARSLADDPTSTTISGLVSAWVDAARGDTVAALDWADRACAAAPAAQETARRLGPHLVRAMVRDSHGDSVGARSDIVADQHTADDLAAAIRVPFRHVTTALLDVRAGRFDDAVTEVDAGLQASSDLDVGAVDTWLSSLTALIALHREGPDAAAALLTPITSQLGSDWRLWVEGLVHLVRGETTRAIELLELVAGVGLAVGSAGSAALVAPDLARACRRIGEPERCRPVLDACAAAGITSPVLLERLAWAAGVADGDAAAIETAAERLGPVRVVDAAEAWHDAAVMWAAEGDARAREAARRALDGYESLGAESSAARLRADLRTFGIRLRTGAPARARFGWDAVTPTERMVVDLVAEGCTNAEISARLYISRRTVESHLVHVYAKVGAGSRVELAAMVRAATSR